MKDLILYIGTSARDIFQFECLINSIRAYNMDNIPVHVCVNDDDHDLFVTKFARNGITFHKDSDVYKSDEKNVWFKQQYIKMNFWRLNIAKIMVQLDSDSFFVKNFYRSDFMVTDTVPYTVLHENKELREFFAQRNLFKSNKEDNGDFWVDHSFVETSKSIRKNVFGNLSTTAGYDYGHPPCIWSNAVWEYLYNTYVQPNNLTYESLLKFASSEQQWYGETLLASSLFPIYPKENLFKTFHYSQNLHDFLRVDKLDNVKYNYHGICLQSNWSANTPEMKMVYSHFFDRGNNPKMYNGQFGEDKWILENIDVPEKGVVVDVGADQPIFGSNTYYFEKYLGWQSICIDADARTIEKLKTKRKNVVHAAVSDKDGRSIKFHQHELAGISAVDANGEVEVPCYTLNTILEKSGITEITLLDIEGHEPYVIRGLDWKKYDPQIVVIEYGSPAGGIIKDELMKFFSDLGGYQLVYTSPANLIYVKAV